MPPKRESIIYQPGDDGVLDATKVEQLLEESQSSGKKQRRLKNAACLGGYVILLSGVGYGLLSGHNNYTTLLKQFEKCLIPVCPATATATQNSTPFVPNTSLHQLQRAFSWASDFDKIRDFQGSLYLSAKQPNTYSQAKVELFDYYV